MPSLQPDRDEGKKGTLCSEGVPEVVLQKSLLMPLLNKVDTKNKGVKNAWFCIEVVEREREREENLKKYETFVSVQTF